MWKLQPVSKIRPFTPSASAGSLTVLTTCSDPRRPRDRLRHVQEPDHLSRSRLSGSVERGDYSQGRSLILSPSKCDDTCLQLSDSEATQETNFNTTPHHRTQPGRMFTSRPPPSPHLTSSDHFICFCFYDQWKLQQFIVFFLFFPFVK